MSNFKPLLASAVLVAGLAAAISPGYARIDAAGFQKSSLVIVQTLPSRAKSGQKMREHEIRLADHKV